MARKITWKSDDNQTCILTIDDGSNTVINLTPAAEPFTTSIQESDDIFTPIRTSNGYIRIVVDSVDDITDLVGSSPKRRPVLLEVDNFEKWVGFLACESFTQPWDKGPVELELPVVSPLEVARGVYPSSDLMNLGYINFAQFIYNMNNALGAPYTEFFFPYYSAPSTNLRYQFDMRNYAVTVDNNTGHEVESYYTILEDICKLFGWQAIEYESSLVFLAADVKLLEQGNGNAYRGYYTSRLAQLAAGTNTSPSENPAFTPVIPTIFGSDHNMSWLAGRKRVEAVGEISQMKTNIWSMDILNQCVYNGTSNKTKVISLDTFQQYAIQKEGAYQSPDASSVNGNIQAFNSIFGVNNPDTDGNNVKFANFNNSTPTAYGGCATCEQLWTYDIGSGPIAGSRTYTYRIITKANSNSYLKCVDIHTNFYFTPTQNNDVFEIEADIKKANTAEDYFEPVSGESYAEVALIIDDNGTLYYYNAQTDGWTNIFTVVVLGLKDGKVVKYGYRTSSGASFPRIRMSAPSNVSGEVIMRIVAINDPVIGQGDAYLSFENIKISHYTLAFFTANVDRIGNNEKKVSMENGFSDSWDQTCGLTLARGTMYDCPNVVLDANKHTPSALYDGKYPEDAMADRASAYFSQARLRIKAIVKSVGEMLNPLIPYRFTSNGQPFICIEQQQNWRTNEVTGSFFEPTYNTL